MMNGADQPGSRRRIAALEELSTATRISPPTSTVSPLATNPVRTVRKIGVADIQLAGSRRSVPDQKARNATAGSPGHHASIRGKIIAVTAAPE
ncbi:hypothetical protein nbrc107696_28740 [Gordonia spumicola]|uniref:Uncharacterized protein n=1 Tax=Gordonia spumicola TaxID=589161 RepID=A0A7I9VAM6_9ACTN|nr:hypothetical protein nbrc107696_28740 [Gordonia spumicola]